MIYLFLGLVLTVPCVIILLTMYWETRSYLKIAKKDVSIDVDPDLDDLIYQIGLDQHDKKVIYHETVQ